MTQRGKCDICRARKVKCDEKRPVCGQCQRKGRPCNYAHGESRFVSELLPTEATSDAHPQPRQAQTCFDLTLKSSQPAPAGTGTFHQFRVGEPLKARLKEKRASHAELSKTAAPQQSSTGLIAFPAGLTNVPSDDTTHLRQALVARLNNPYDCRYDPTFRFGPFLFAVPRRLGINPSLDAATEALLARHTEVALRQDQTVLHAPAVRAYNHALSELRRVLDDPGKAASFETLCAILILTMCQARFDDQFTFFWSPHALGVAQVCRTLGFPAGATLWERCVFAQLNTTLLLQSFANPAVQLSGSEYRKLRGAIDRTVVEPMDARHWEIMLQLSQLMARGRHAFRSGLPVNDLGLEAKNLEEALEPLLVVTRTRMTDREPAPLDQVPHRRLHAAYQRAYGMLLGTSAILQSAQRTLAPCNHEVPYRAATLCQEVLQLTREARVYRPLGAVWTVHVLLCTWCAVAEPGLKSAVEAALLDYQRDAMGSKAAIRRDQLELLERRLCLVE